ncbi:nucleotidyltransferase family protein [Polynucleobacter sp. 15G-AUS-farblos]|uniref:nucleotidyltransferase family protein n=1 Tax=Polynucleobacter sp. 15G-AUS-farblos TaxID=2689094 RepID=UPI001C0DFF0C|nr:nucleotidyltransferase family protein [Polynucleobacter sp. 15G-AUS-farblos]MBU3582414.1 nucleotidyltransferase family protein [Polynucleobacter sp. 15G-AUS-farblos]
MTLTGISPLNTRLRLAILLLAAGEGSRLGGHPKALLKKDGKTLLRSFISCVEEMAPVEVVIVTGFYAQAIESEIESCEILNLPIQIVRSPHPQAGQASSVRLGIETLKSDYDVLLVALSDQPNIGSTEIGALLDQYRYRSAHEEIVLPQVNGQRGNPVLFSKKAVEAILSMPEMVCRPYMDQNPALVKIYETDNTAFILDVDTEADIQKLGISR